MTEPLFKCPPDLFQQIEARVLRHPELLDMGEYHLLPDGTEAMSPRDIVNHRTAHCLQGWIIALTPKAPDYERLRDDVDDFANDILKANGRLPIPFGIIYGERESALRVIRGRAAEERALARAGEDE
jgi:hypothetical protein